MRPTIKGAAALAAISAAAMAVTPLASATDFMVGSGYNYNATVIPGEISAVKGGNVYGADRIATSIQALTAYQADPRVAGTNGVPSINLNATTYPEALTAVKTAMATVSGTYTISTSGNITETGKVVDLYIVSTTGIVDALSLAPISRGNGSGGFVLYANQSGLDERGYDALSNLISQGAVRRVFIVGGEKALSSKLEEQVYDASMTAKKGYIDGTLAIWKNWALKTMPQKTQSDIASYGKAMDDVRDAVEAQADALFGAVHFARLAGSDRYATAYQAGAWAADYKGLSSAYEGTYVFKRDALAIQYAANEVQKTAADYADAVRNQVMAETKVVQAATALSQVRAGIGFLPADYKVAFGNLPTAESLSSNTKREVKNAEGFSAAVDDLYTKASALFESDAANTGKHYDDDTTVAYSPDKKLSEVVTELTKADYNVTPVDPKKPTAEETAKVAAYNAAMAVKKYTDANTALMAGYEDGSKDILGDNDYFFGIIDVYQKDKTVADELVTDAKGSVTAIFDTPLKGFVAKKTEDPKGSGVYKVNALRGLIDAKDIYVSSSKKQTSPVINYGEIARLGEYLVVSSPAFASAARELLDANKAAVAAALAVEDAEAARDAAIDALAAAKAQFDADQKVDFYKNSPMAYGKAITDAYTNSVKAVFFTTGENFADALTAGPAAASKKGGVVILTPGKTFDSWAKSAGFLPAAKFYAVGGPAAEAAKANGVDLAGSYVGQDRYETSVKLNNAFFGTNKKLYVVASGETGADSVVAGAYQASVNNYGSGYKGQIGGIILTAKSELPAAADNFFKSLRWGFQAAAFFGGNGVITNDVRAQVLTDMGASQKVLNDYISNNTFGYGN